MTAENSPLTSVCLMICCPTLRTVKSMLVSITSTVYGKKMPIRNRHSLCSVTSPLRRMTVRFRCITTSERNLSREAFPKAKLNLYTRQIPTSRRKNCSKRPVRARSEYCSVLLKRWVPAQMFRTDLSHFTMWIVRGDRRIWSSVPVELFVKAIQIPM